MSAPERAAGDRALLRFLARQGRLTTEDVARVERLLDEQGTSVHEVLEREGLIGQKDLALLLAETLRLRIVDLTTYPLDANVTRELKETVATRYEVVPISIDGRTIEVVTANPLDLDGLKAVEFATGKRVQAVVATHVEVKDALAHTYRLQESLEQFLQLVPASESLVVNELSDEGDDLRMIAADAELPPVIKLADKMLIEGIKSRASDIHVEPETDSVLVRYRVDGILEEAFRFPKWIQNPLVARLKVMAKLDITERRLPQDGRIQVRFQDKSVDMRVSSLPAQHGEKITLRILDASQAVKALDRLGFDAADLKLLRDAAKKPQGLILITGPTGSGKTTTLYALLREIFSPKTNIVTIENPIEYQLKGINQVEVNEKQGLTFGGVLRSVLRQDPDVILLGEIRDKETAQIAFQAASTGHLVLSTVHTNDAAGAVTRLLDLGLEPYAIASALNLVVAQRLVRQLCPTCNKPTEVDPETRRQLHIDEGATIKQAVGCAQCRHSGYRSRIGVYEMLPMTSAVTKLIEAGAGESMVRQQARSEGVHTILEDAVEKLRNGITTVDELQRVVQIADGNGGVQCPGCKKDIAEDYSVCPHCSKVLRASCGGCAKPLNPEWVRCPYCGAAAVVEETPATELPASTPRRSFKALVVDDTATIRDVVQHTLEHSDLGLTVLAAEDGPQALDIAGRERPDIIILDISMPGMDGFEVCRRLRSEMRTAFVPVLMLTAHDSEDDVARGFGVGADDYMVKPFRREGLVARVRRILERTYGSQAVGAPPLPDSTARPAAPAAVASVAAFGGVAGVDVAARLAELAADRDALHGAIAACETRLGALADALAAGAPAPSASTDGPVVDTAALDEVRALVGELRAAQEQRFEALRADTQRALTLAEEALASARAAAPPPIDFAAVLRTVETLQGEHATLRSALDAAQSQGHGADEECERRLRLVTQEIEALRASGAALESTWQRELGASRAEAHAAAEEAAGRVAGEVASAVTRLTQSVGAVQTDLATQREELSRESGRVRAAEAQAGRVQDEALAAAEKTARELAAVQRAFAEQYDRQREDLQRIAGAEESARRARADLQAAADQMADDLAVMRRTLAEQREVAADLGARIDGAAGEARQARGDAAAAARLGEELTALRDDVAGERAARMGEVGRLASAEGGLAEVRAEIAAAAERSAHDLAELRRLVAVQQELQSATGMDPAQSEAAWQSVQREAVAAAEAAARALRDDALAAAEAAAQLVRNDAIAAAEAIASSARVEAIAAAETASRAAFGEAEAATQTALRAAREDVRASTEAALRAVQDEARVAAERVTADVVALGESVTAQQDAQQQQIAWLQGRLEHARRVAVQLVRRVRVSGRALAADVEARDAECEQQLAAVREQIVVALAAVRAEHAVLVRRVEELPSGVDHRTVQASVEGVEGRIAELDDLKSAVVRLDGDHRRHAADVEERLRGLMRTAAGGFDVQLALLRGKVEVLARTLRERMPTDPGAPADDALLQHRHGLMDLLRQQLAVLQGGGDWRPQRVLDLLIESTLAAAITPFRRMLQLAQGETSEPAETPASADAPTVTDESTSPS